MVSQACKCVSNVQTSDTLGTYTWGLSVSLDTHQDWAKVFVVTKKSKTRLCL